LEWLWDQRIAQHIFELDRVEYDKYSKSDFSKAIKATKALMRRLKENPIP
jgi:hypothetical protein